MGTFLRLTAADNHHFDGYRADPPSASRGGVVVVQEIFGVNQHIREVTDRFAAAGYTAIAPALFDRVRPNVELGYTPEGIEEGRSLSMAIGWDVPVHDIRAAAEALQTPSKAGIVGYCWGASWTWLAACRAPFAGAVCYYGRHIVDLLNEQPRGPILMHFGQNDASIPLENVQRIRAANPNAVVHVYDHAGHGFNCDRRADYAPDQAKLAMERTLEFFSKHIG